MRRSGRGTEKNPGGPVFMAMTMLLWQPKNCVVMARFGLQLNARMSVTSQSIISHRQSQPYLGWPFSPFILSESCKLLSVPQLSLWLEPARQKCNAFFHWDTFFAIFTNFSQS